jgi:hypothetical protein
MELKIIGGAEFTALPLLKSGFSRRGIGPYKFFQQDLDGGDRIG